VVERRKDREERERRRADSQTGLCT